MKNNVRKALAISGLAIAIGTSGVTLASTASANTGKTVLRSHQERIVRTKKIEATKHETTRRIVFGTVSNIDSNSFTLTRGSKTFTVNTDSNTKILNKKWETVALTDIKSGDKVRVLGTISATTVSAKTVRDITQ